MLRFQMIRQLVPMMMVVVVMVMMVLQERDEVELMLAKLQCIDLSSSEIVDTVDTTTSQLQDANTNVQSLTQQLASGKERCQQLEKECQDSKDILSKEVGFSSDFSLD